jgi:hypothetical protein
MNSSLRTTNLTGHTLAGHGLTTGRPVLVQADRVPRPERDDDHGIPKRQERLLLTVILLLAALLRLGWPGIVQFSLDEAQTMGLALEVVEGRGVPLFGTGTSFGLPTSPMSEYVYVPAALLWDNPLWLTWFTAALNMVALALFWRLSRRYWGPQVALCATLVFATHPWAVVSSRKIWEPNLIAFFAIPWAITGELAFHERQPRALVIHLALLWVIAQLHYSGLALLPVTALMLLLARKHVDRRMLAAGIVAAAIIALPFVYGVIRTRGEGWRASLSFVSGAAKIDSQALRLWWITATGSDIHSLAGWPAYREFLRSLPNLGILRSALGALVGAGIGLWLLEALRSRRDTTPSSGLLVSLWALAPLLLLVRHVRPLHLHYYVVAIPALCLAAGLVLGRAATARLRTLRAGAMILVIILGGTQALTTVSILRFVGSQATPGGFGVPLQSQLRAADRARALGPPLIVLADGDDPRLSNWAAVFEVLAHRVPHRVLDGSRLALFPGEPATVLTTPGAHTAVQAYSEAGLLDLAEVVPNRRGEEPFRILRLKGGLTPELRPAPEPRRLAHGAEVVGYRVDGELKPGRAFDWWISWRIWREPPKPPRRYHISNRLVGAGDTYVTQADGPTIPPWAWKVGDLIVQRFRMKLPAQVPAGPLWMKVGMYTYPQLENQPVLDANGQAVGDAVVLKLISGE